MEPSFCHSMEQCLSDQQFFTVLLYLDDISIYALSIDTMIEAIGTVFGKLKDFHLKIKPKEYHFFEYSVVFKTMFCQLMASLPTLRN